MSNQILYQRICKMIAITYAIKEETIFELFSKSNSIDKVLDDIAEGKLYGK